MATNSTTVKLTMKITSFVVRLLLNIIFYILVILLIVYVSKEAYNFTYQIYGPITMDLPGEETKVVLQINKGDQTMDVADKLELHLVIPNKYSFYIKTKLQDAVIMPGTYKLTTAMTYDEILSIITDYSKSLVKEDEAESKEIDSEQ